MKTVESVQTRFGPQPQIPISGLGNGPHGARKAFSRRPGHMGELVYELLWIKRTAGRSQAKEKYDGTKGPRLPQSFGGPVRNSTGARDSGCPWERHIRPQHVCHQNLPIQPDGAMFARSEPTSVPSGARCGNQLYIHRVTTSQLPCLLSVEVARVPAHGFPILLNPYEIPPPRGRSFGVCRKKGAGAGT
jgi:hypothetical protein